MATAFKTNYNCTSCGHKWFVIAKEVKIETPECPQCKVLKQYEPKDLTNVDTRTMWKPGAGSLKARAVDEVYKMAEQDYGMTDMKDNLRPGDIAYKMPNNDVSEMVSPEMAGQLKKQGGSIFGGGTAPAMAQQHNALTMAAGARAERAAHGIGNPFDNFQKTLKKANAPSVIDNARRGPLGIRAK